MAARAFAELEQTDTALKLDRAQDFVGEILTRVDNSLTVATLLARAESIDTADTDIDTVLALAIGDMPDAQRGRISIVRSTPTRTVLMDMSLMRIALRNLLANALNFSPAGSEVEVQLSDNDAPLAFVIDVSNSGNGIAEDHINALFYKSQRPSQTDFVQRQGLGLYIVRRIMELHGGSASLLRNGACGSSFRLVLPPIEPD
jgi:signal transduction histidine kinase